MQKQYLRGSISCKIFLILRPLVLMIIAAILWRSNSYQNQCAPRLMPVSRACVALYVNRQMNAITSTKPCFHGIYHKYIHMYVQKRIFHCEWAHCITQGFPGWVARHRGQLVAVRSRRAHGYCTVSQCMHVCVVCVGGAIVGVCTYFRKRMARLMGARVHDNSVAASCSLT